MVFAWHGLGRSGAFGVQIQIQKYKNTKWCLPGMDWEGLVLVECRGSPSNATPTPRKGLRTL